MTYILLLGAGFSRNYGGWLADELTGDIMGRVSHDPELLKHLQDQNGFEAALEAVRGLYKQDPGHRVNAQRFFTLQDAISASFAEMNAVFEARGHMEFQNGNASRYVNTFLARFDAIFTLNQDLLLELLYKPRDFNEYSGREWQGIDLPGMSYVAKDGDQDEIWIPTAGTTAFDPRPGCQPVVKLHGSVKWLGIGDRPSSRDSAERMLIIGTNKAGDIERSRVLSRYFQKFKEELARAGARLMVIGYGFRDAHINDAIAACAGLETFIVDPAGRRVVESLNITRQRGVGIMVPQPIEQIKLIGVSRRSLSQSFGNDQLAWNQLMRFFRT